MTKKDYTSPKAEIICFDANTLTSINQSSVQMTFNKKNKSIINNGNVINF